MPDIVSTAGDCFNRIAKANGFFNYRSVYDHLDNAANFPNPNQVEEGSTIKVPEKKMKAFDVNLDAEKHFKIIRKPTNLKIKICKADITQALAIKKATLDLAGKKINIGTPTLNNENIDPLVTSATLTVKLEKPSAYAAPPPTDVGVADQYPPSIKAPDFDDPKTEWPKKGETIIWSLQIGSLEPHTVTRGVLQRLENLGFTCPVQKLEDATTQRVVKTYRRAVENRIPPADTGAVADISAHIKARHDD
jgi:hypothetical protein